MGALLSSLSEGGRGHRGGAAYWTLHTQAEE